MVKIGDLKTGDVKLEQKKYKVLMGVHSKLSGADWEIMDKNLFKGWNHENIKIIQTWDMFRR